MGTIAPLVTKLVMDSGEFIRGLDGATTAAERSARRMSGAMRAEMRQMREAAQQSTSAIEKGFSSLGTAMAALGVAGGAGIAAQMVKEGLQVADTYTQIESRIKLATRATNDFKQVNDALYSSAQKTGVAFESTAQIFQRLQMSSRDLGKNNTEMIKLVDQVQKLGILSGASTASLNAGLMQFGQLMGSGVAHAEELNSIAENLPALQKRIADGFGMSWAQIKQAAADGKILSKDVFDVIMKGAEETDRQIASMPMTMQRGWQILENATMKAVGAMNDATGTTTDLGQAMNATAQFIDDASKKFEIWAKQKDERGLNYFEGQKVGWTAVTLSIQDAINKFKEYQQLQREREGKQYGGFGLLQALGAAGGELIGGLNFGASGERATNELKIAELQKQIKAKQDELAAKKANPTGKQYGPPVPDKEQQKSIDKFMDYLGGLQEQAHLIQLVNQGLKEQSAIEKALYEATQRKGSALNATEEKMITAAAKEKFAAEQAKKAAEDAVKRNEKWKETAEKVHDAYIKIQQKFMDIQNAIQAQNEALALTNVADESSVKIAQERYELEKKIAELRKGYDVKNPDGTTRHVSLTDEGEDSLRFQFEQRAMAIAGNAQAQKTTKLMESLFNGQMGGMDAMQFARQSNGNSLEDRLSREWNAIQSKMENDRQPSSDIAAVKQQFGVYADRQRSVELESQLRTLRDQTQEMANQQRQKDLINQGLDQQAAYEREVLAMEKSLGRELTAQERQIVANNTAAQTFYERMDKARDLINSMKTTQEKYNDRVRELNQFWQSGLLSVQQYNRLLIQMSPQFQKMHDVASDMASAMGKAFDDAILKGGKFTDVMKNLGKEMLNIMAKRLIIDPFVNWSTGMLTQLFTGVNPNKPIGPFNPNGAQPGQPVGAPPVANQQLQQLLQQMGMPPQLIQQLMGMAGAGGGGGGVPGAAGNGSQMMDGIVSINGHTANIEYLTQQMVALLQQLAMCSCGGGAGGGYGPYAGGGGGFANPPVMGMPFSPGGAGMPGMGFGGGGAGGGWNSGPAMNGAGGIPSYAFQDPAAYANYLAGADYQTQANAMSQLAKQQADRALKMNMPLSNIYFENQAKQWAGWATQVPSGTYNAFGLAPQIFQTAGTWAGMLSGGTIGQVPTVQAHGYFDPSLSYGVPSGPYNPTDYSINPNQYVARGSIFHEYNNGNYMTQGDWNAISGDHSLGGSSYGGTAPNYNLNTASVMPPMAPDYQTGLYGGYQQGNMPASPYSNYQDMKNSGWFPGAVLQNGRWYYPGTLGMSDTYNPTGAGWSSGGGGAGAALPGYTLMDPGNPFAPRPGESYDDWTKRKEQARANGMLDPTTAGAALYRQGLLGMAPKRARGGRVTAGQWYEVNENGHHEYFQPDTSGNIVNPSANGNISIVVNQNAPGVEVQQKVTPMPGGGQQVDIIVDRIQTANLRNNRSSANEVRRIATNSVTRR